MRQKEFKIPKLKPRALIKHLSVYDWLRVIRQQNQSKRHSKIFLKSHCTEKENGLWCSLLLRKKKHENKKQQLLWYPVFLPCLSSQQETLLLWKHQVWNYVHSTTDTIYLNLKNKNKPWNYFIDRFEEIRVVQIINAPSISYKWRGKSFSVVRVVQYYHALSDHWA